MSQGVVEVLLGKIISLLENETSILGGIRCEFNEIKSELESMKSFLRDADRRGLTNQGIRTWVEQVRDVAYDVEDVIDEFMYFVSSQRRITNFMGKQMDTIKNVWMRRKIASRVRVLQTQVKNISERSKRYRFDDTEATNPSDAGERLRRLESCPLNEDENLVGIGKDRDLIFKWLNEGEPQRTVMSVCGMGGSGKTTLVSSIYNNQNVRSHFDCYAWITVSQNYKIQELLRRLLKELFDSRKELVAYDLRTMEYRQLMEILVDYLGQMRYFIVLDDVWSISLWREIKTAVPEGRKRSRIILTTRNEDIASFSFGVGNYIHHIQPLQEDEAWSFFCRIAFSYVRNNCCPNEVTEIARLIVSKCQGLPLAIVAMGGLMSKKSMTETEWMTVYNSLSWELNNNPTLEVVKSILFLSYNDLPYFLRHCFLYFSLFPEDSFIKPNRLFRLWIAEGFVAERRGMTLEEVAETYFMELVSRNMVQVEERRDCGRPTLCRMHDLLRELALSTSESENFCLVYEESVAIEVCRVRRLSIHAGDSSIPFFPKLCKLRSFFLFVGNTVPGPISSALPSGFSLLRVLELQGAPIEKLPEELVKLFNLRYLNLRDTFISELPKALGRLINLQTLDTRNSRVKAIPTTIVSCQNLRNLSGYCLTNGDHLTYERATGVQATAGICNLKHLQVINGIEATDEIVKQLGKLTQLHKIGFVKIREEHGTELCKAVEKLKLLNTLSLMVYDARETLQMDAIWSPPPLLQKINFIGKLEKVPVWLGALHLLTSLCLRWSRLTEDPFTCIHALPRLSKLFLINAYNGRKLYFRKEWFPKLKFLSLSTLPELNQVTIEEGALPRLQFLDLVSCQELKMVPDGIEHLINLQKLYLANAPEELVEQFRGGADRQKFQHIPEIGHHNKTNDGWNYERLSSASVNNDKYSRGSAKYRYII